MLYNTPMSYYDGIKADIWAIGVTLYLMVFNRYPFFSSNFMHLFELIKTQEVKFDDNPSNHPDD
jgi:serine/threonine protein kinase